MCVAVSLPGDTLCHISPTHIHTYHLTPNTLQVKDFDLVGKHDDLGDYSLRIDDLPPLKPVDLELALCHTTKVGTPDTCMYISVSEFCGWGRRHPTRNRSTPTTQPMKTNKPTNKTNKTIPHPITGLPLRPPALPPRAAAGPRGGGRPWYACYACACIYTRMCLWCLSDLIVLLFCFCLSSLCGVNPPPSPLNPSPLTNPP